MTSESYPGDGRGLQVAGLPGSSRVPPGSPHHPGGGPLLPPDGPQDGGRPLSTSPLVPGGEDMVHLVDPVTGC